VYQVQQSPQIPLTAEYGIQPQSAVPGNQYYYSNYNPAQGNRNAKVHSMCINSTLPNSKKGKKCRKCRKLRKWQK
jgi:hypothetical protein